MPQRGEKTPAGRAGDRKRQGGAGHDAREVAGRPRARREQALEQLQDELDLPAIPRRIECYDISNIQGTSPVSSMVVFVDGKPRRKQYRRFRIKTVVGANDFASMAEIMRRRFRGRARTARLAGDANGAVSAGRRWTGQRLSSPRTSGRQVPQATHGTCRTWSSSTAARASSRRRVDAMREMGVKQIPAVGLAKRTKRSSCRTSAEPVVLPRTSEALYLVQRIRDEAHRFAITYHRRFCEEARCSPRSTRSPASGRSRRRRC